MTDLQIIVLAIVQGLTEFLPISSSAHLILVPVLTEWQDQGLSFDIAVHVGTLLAVVGYFRRDLAVLLAAWSRSVTRQQHDNDSRLAWQLLMATLPVVVVGAAMGGTVETFLRNPLVIATATLVFGLLLWVADRLRVERSDEHQLGWRQVMSIGAMQVLALIPGTSRSGITMTAGLLLGLGRQAAARFSFLLAIPVITAAGVYNLGKLLGREQAVDWYALSLGTLISFISAYLCIHFFLKLIDRVGMLPFVIYRLLLAGVLFYLFA